MESANINGDGVAIPLQDLAQTNPGTEDDGRLYNHDGSSSITLTDGTTSTEKGFYMWDQDAGGWHPMKTTIQAAERFETNGSTAIVRDTTNALDVARFLEGGKVEIPNGVLQVQGAYRINDTQISRDGLGAKMHLRADKGLTVDSGHGGSDAEIDLALNGTTGINIEPNGNVEIPNGSLRIDGDDLELREATTDDTRGIYFPQTNYADVVFNMLDGTLRAYNTSTGNPIWQADVGGDVRVPNGELTVQGVGVKNHLDSSTNPHGVTANQAGALPDDGSGAMSGDLDVGGNYVDNRSGHFSGYLSTAMSDVTGGVLANFAENTPLNDAPITVDSSSQITINRAGKYRISYSCTFNQTSGGSRQVMAATVQRNGVDLKGRTESSCYIRNDTNGDENSVSGDPILDLSSGDTLGLRVWEKQGGQTTDLLRCHVHIEYLG